MRISDLKGTLRGASPDAEVVICLKVTDGLGYYLLLCESAVLLADYALLTTEGF